MKTKYKKGIAVLLMLSVLCSLVSVPVNAEESSPGIPIRWSIKSSSGYYQTKISYDRLPTGHVMRSTLQTAVNNWNSTGTKILCSRVSGSSANVELSVGSETFWAANLQGVAAYTFVTDTNGTLLFTVDDYNNTTGKIRYANIQFNPNLDPNATAGSTYAIGMLVHEIGHVYGMGHTTTYASVMNANRYYYYSRPQTYDIQVANSFYP